MSDLSTSRAATTDASAPGVAGQGIEPAPATRSSTWLACPGCGWLLYRKRLERNLHVCPECDHHLRLSARDRIAQLTDAGTFAERVLPPLPPDPLQFNDLRPYRERLRDAERRSEETEAAVVGTAAIGGHPIVLVVMDFAFLGGSMGVEVGRRVAYAAELALERRQPLLAVCASGGARMQEGVLALAQMARTSQAFGSLHEAGVLTACLLTDPTYGGVSASFAALGSVVIAERGAHIGFAGPRVVEQTIRAQLPAGFQTAEFLLAHGLIDQIGERAELRPLLTRLLAMHEVRQAPRAGALDDAGPSGTARTSGTARNSGTAGTPRGSAAGSAVDRVPSGEGPDPWDVVQSARDVNRPTTLDYIHVAFDDFIELHGDRATGDDPAIVAGIGSICGMTVAVAGQQKGHSVKDLVARNFGMAHPEGYRKVLRLLDYAERFRLPVVTFVDTPGAHPGLAAEEGGQSVAIAQTILRMGRLRTPIVSIVTGEGGSGGALALCTSDRLLMLERSYLSVISPEGCAAILWRSPAAAPQAARALRLLPQQLLALGIATSVIAEPPAGAQADPLGAASLVREALIAELAALAEPSGSDPEALVTARVTRFSSFGNLAGTAELPGSQGRQE